MLKELDAHIETLSRRPGRYCVDLKSRDDFGRVDCAARGKVTTETCFKCEKRRQG